MSAPRWTAGGPRLVLVRGGLDARTSDEGTDWEDFCERIGWSEDPAGPPPDLEERLRRHLFAPGARELRPLGDDRHGGIPDGARHPDGAAAADFDGDGQGRPVSVWARGATTAVAIVAVAAMVALLVSTLLPASVGRPVAASPEPTTDPAVRATTAPRVDRSRPVDAPPPDAEPEGPAPDADAPPPEPHPTPRPRPLVRPAPPGTRVAEATPARGRDRDRAPRAAEDPIADASLAAPLATPPAVAPALAIATAPGLALPASTALALPPADVTASELPAPRPSGWALSGASNRWVGVSVSPEAAPGERPRLGVMAQLDLAKAFGKL